MYHLLTCTVMEGRRSGCSRIFHLGLFLVDRMNPIHIHPNRFRIRPRQSDFDSSSRWIFSLKSCRSPRNRRYFPRFYSCPPCRVGFGDRRPRFERVHQVPTFLISQFFRQSQSFSTRVSCFQGREQQPGLTTAGTPFGQVNLGDESLNIVRCVFV